MKNIFKSFFNGFLISIMYRSFKGFLNFWPISMQVPGTE